MIERDDRSTTYYINDERALATISPAEAISAISAALKLMHQQGAHSLPRRRIYVEKQPGEYFWHNSMAAWHEAESTLAIRVDVANVRVSDQGNMEFPGDFSGFVMLFDAQSCTPYAIIQDHLLSPLRVAATSAIASKLMARTDSKVLSLIGGGEQAHAHAKCFVEAFPGLEEIRFFVRTASRRSAIAERLSSDIAIPVVAARDPETVVSGADIIIAATNAHNPVFRGEWVEAGQHLVTIASPDKYLPRMEVDETSVLAASTIVVNSIEQIFADEQEPLNRLLKRGMIKEEDLVELGDLVREDMRPDRDAGDVTLYDNNVGMGIQFAALGPLIVRRAIQDGLAKQIPSEAFMTRRKSTDEKFAP